MMFVLEPIVTSLTLDMRELDPGGMKVYPWLRRDASGCVLVVEFRLLRLCILCHGGEEIGLESFCV